MKTRFTMIIAASLSVALPAAAQDFAPMYTPDFAGNMAWQGMVANQVERDSERSRANGSSTPRVAGGSTGSARHSVATTYRASPAVRARVETQYLAFIGQNAPADADIVRADLARFDAPDAWSRIVGRTGFRSGDVADAMAAYWILNWMIANNETADRPDDRARAAAVKRQVSGIIASDPTFTALDDAQKQEMAEALMLNFIYQHKVFSEAARTGDSGLQGRLAQAAVSRFRSEMGVDLRQLRLTTDGFAPGA